MKTVALLGLSGNPVTPAHFEMAKYIYQALDVDEVWFLFSTNWQKDPSKYASIEDRMELGRIMAQHYPDMPFTMSDIQNQLGTHITHKVLQGLQSEFPDHRFIWVMGADNLASFHTWEHFDSIMENFPIAVLRRPPYTERALHSHTALSYAHLKIESPKDLRSKDRGWCLLDNPEIDMSSSYLLEQLRAGQRIFPGPFQDVADYIVKNGKYGITDQAAFKNTHQPAAEPL